VNYQDVSTALGIQLTKRIIFEVGDNLYIF